MPPIKRLLTFALAFLLALSLSLAVSHPSQAQFPLPEGFGGKGPVGREFRLRVRKALAASGIEIGMPQYYSLDAA